MDTTSTQEIDLGNLVVTSHDNSADPLPLLREEHGRLAIYAVSYERRLIIFDKG